MLKSLYIFFVLIVTAVNAFSQDTLVLQGHYYGKNIYVMNPSIGNDTSFCIQKVLINGQPSKDEIHSNSFEIDFSLMNIQNEAPLKILIIHNAKCHPKIINPEVIQMPNTFAFVNTKVDKTGKIIWVVKGDLYSDFIVEEFRWNKWITIGTVAVSDTMKKNVYALDTKPYFGNDEYRISQTDEKGNTVYSKLIKYHSTTKEIFLTTTKVTTEITFTGETAYEVFDEKGNFISDGYGISVNITDLPKGKYLINYDNKTEMVSKK